MIRSLPIFVLAALSEIAGCFCFFLWLRLGRSWLWLAPGAASLLLFAWLLTLVEVDTAGRSYAIYGGIYIATSLFWLWGVEGQRPDRFDLAGGALCVIGAAVIFLTPRG